MTDEELKDLVASLAIAQRETGKQLKELGEQTDKHLKDLGEQTDKHLKDLVASIAVTQKETDEQLKRTDEQIEKFTREVNKDLRELKKQIGGLGEKFGSFTEGFAFPSMQKVLTEQFGMEYIATRYRMKKSGKNLELDVFAYTNGNENKAFIVEVKSHLREEHIQQILNQLKEIKWFLPDHANKTFYGILAMVDSPKNLREKVLENGIYLAEIHDDVFKIKVPKRFKARAF